MGGVFTCERESAGLSSERGRVGVKELASGLDGELACRQMVGAGGAFERQA